MRVMIMTWVYRAEAYARSSLHYRTLWHVVLAYFRGLGQSIAAVTRFVNATSKAELKITSPDKHHAETSFRRLLVALALALLIVVAVVVLATTGRAGALALLVAQAALFVAIGRTDALVVRVVTSRMVTEQLLVKITNELTLTPAQMNQGHSGRIIQAPARLAVGRGYDVVVRVSDQGKPRLLIDNSAGVAHKLTKGASHVFTYDIKADASQARILVLDVDPWSLPPTQNPLVVSPRRVNLWRETVSMGTAPDFTDVREQLVEEGDGGGRLAGAAPRAGKTNLLSNWLVPLMLDPTTHLHIVDGSAVDFSPLRGIADSFVGDPEISDVQLLAQAHRIVKELKAECARRKPILFKWGTNKLNEEISDKHNLGTHWYINDELASITASLLATNKKAVEEFLADLIWLVSNGPKFGVFAILATQRPNEKSVPPDLKDLIILRSAGYIPSDSGSRAILGQSGPRWRADHLDPEQKGVILAIGVGQYRTHKVTPHDLASVARVAASIRAQHGAGTLPPDTAMVHPEPVATILEIMSSPRVDEIGSLTLVERLMDLGHTSVTEKKLAQSLTPWGIQPRRMPIEGTRIRGYSRAELERVPKISRVVSSPVPGTDLDSEGQDDWDGIEVAAHVDQEEGS